MCYNVARSILNPRHHLDIVRLDERYCDRKDLLSQQAEDAGYVVVYGLLDVEKDLQPIIDEYEQVLNGLDKSLDVEYSPFRKSGNLSFEERLTLLMQETNGAIYQNLEISLLKN